MFWRNDSLVVAVILATSNAIHIKFTCTARDPAKLFTTKSVPVQYIHVPKAAGTTIQGQLEKIARFNYMGHERSNNRIMNPRPSFLADGTYYDGHQPIGWQAKGVGTIPLLIVALRNPVELITSLYDYKIMYNGSYVLPPEHQREVDLLRKAEAEVKSRGSHEAKYLDTLIRSRNPVVKDLTKLFQTAFLLPQDCMSSLNLTVNAAKPHINTDLDENKNYKLVLAAALRNLLQVDIVFTTDEMSALSIQLKYQFPRLRNMTLVSANKMNTTTRKRQELSDQAITVLKGNLETSMDIVLYSFAKRISKARTSHAIRCLNDERLMVEPSNGNFDIWPTMKSKLRSREFSIYKHCIEPCDMQVSTLEMELLKMALPRKCLPYSDVKFSTANGMESNRG